MAHVLCGDGGRFIRCFVAFEIKVIFKKSEIVVLSGTIVKRYGGTHSRRICPIIYASTFAGRLEPEFDGTSLSGSAILT